MKLLVIGDRLLDRYYVGKIKRLNPESHRSPLLQVSSTVECPGGAGNVAACLLAMGVSTVGAYGSGAEIIKHRVLDIDEGIVARFDEDSLQNPVEVDRIVRLSHGCDAVVVSDYLKGSVNEEVAKAVRYLHLPTFVDVKGNARWWCDWVFAAIPNHLEYLAEREHYDRVNVCLVKEGKMGASILHYGVKAATVCSEAINVNNVTGAGDVVTATFAAAMLARNAPTFTDLKDVKVAARIAMKMAAVAVAGKYTTVPKLIDASLTEEEMEVFQGCQVKSR